MYIHCTRKQLMFSDYTAYMDYMDPDVQCPKMAVKLNHSLTLVWLHVKYQWSSVKFIITPVKITHVVPLMPNNPISLILLAHYDVMTWKHFLHYWPFEGWIESLVVSPHKRPIIWSFDVFCSLYKLSNKQSSCQWCEMPWSSCDIMNW